MNEIKSQCVAKILVLNDKKTELLHFTLSSSALYLNHQLIHIREPIIHLANHSGNLGVVMDSSLNVTLDVISMCTQFVRGAYCGLLHLIVVNVKLPIVFIIRCTVYCDLFFCLFFYRKASLNNKDLQSLAYIICKVSLDKQLTG